MIIKIEKNKLIEPLKNLVGVAEKKQTMPILGNVLFRTEHKSLLLVASDLEVEISTQVDYQSEEALDSALPGRKLLKISGYQGVFCLEERYLGLLPIDNPPA